MFSAKISNDFECAFNWPIQIQGNIQFKRGKSNKTYLAY